VRYQYNTYHIHLLFGNEHWTNPRAICENFNDEEKQQEFFQLDDSYSPMIQWHPYVTFMGADNQSFSQSEAIWLLSTGKFERQRT
jgi:hypothetical protein